jgi:predicted alpha/beta-hydrolase family hydrolase
MTAPNARPSPQALLLFPGAGSDRTHSSLAAIEEALAPLPVERADFPYRREGRRAPDRPPKLMACVRDEAALLAHRTGVDPAGLVLGGRSMGGRICSLVVADGLPAAGLVLISYPLHPPGRPDQLRVDHFPRLDLPCLFVSGTRDPFGRPEELESHTEAIPGPVTHTWVDGGRHELKNADTQIVGAVRAWLATP